MRHFHLLGRTLFFLFFSIQLGFAQNNVVNQYELNEEDGLPSSRIHDAIHTSDGSIWTSWDNGSLVRINGKSIKEYPKQITSGAEEIQLLEANDGMIWVVSKQRDRTYFTVHIFNPISEQLQPLSLFLNNKIPFSENEILKVDRNFDGTIWLHTKSKTYEYTTDKKIDLWSDKISIEIVFRRYLLKTSKTTACLLTYEVIDKEIQNLKVQHLNQSGKILSAYIIPTEGVTSVHLLPIRIQNKKSSEIYIVLNKGTAFYKTQRTILAKSSIETPYEPLDTLVNRGNKLAYLTNGTTIYSFHDNQITAFDTDVHPIFQTELSDNLGMLLVDNEGGIWFSNERSRLVRVAINSNKFTRYQNELQNERWASASRGIADGPNNDLFITFGETIAHIQQNGTKSSIYSKSDFMGMCLQRDKKVLWLGDVKKISRLNPSTMEITSIPKGDLIIWQPFEDKNGKIWFGTTRGLSYFDPESDDVIEYTNINKYNPLETSSVFAFYENERGIWLSTSSGLYLLDYQKGIIEHYHTKGKGKFHLPFDNVFHLQEDKDGTFWLATKGGGLIHYFPKTGKSEQFTRKNGLIDDVIYACYLDDYGQVWLPSNNGLMRFDKKTKEIIHYTELEGIPHLEFNTISHYKGKNGYLYFGGLNGTIGFNPKDFIPKRGINSVIITGFQKQNQDDEIYETRYAELVSKNKIVFSPDDQSITIQFGLTNINDPKSHNYQYRIEGFDKTWKSLEKPELKISGLPYGNYTIELRAQATGDIWQYYDSPIELTVEKPFYLKWWFFALLLVIALLITLGLLKWQSTRLLKRQSELESIVKERTSEIVKQADELKTLDRMKSQFFANISHELRTPLTLILGPVNALQEESTQEVSDKKLKKNLDVIERNAANLLGIVDEVLELSKLNAGKVELSEDDVLLKEYLKQITSSFESTAELRRIKFRFIYHPSVKLNIKLDQKKFEKVVTNLLSNAFKFTADEGEIQLEITEKASTILVSVSDTGSGIDEEDLPFVFDRFYQSKVPKFTAHGGTGIGLALCYEMTKLMKGKIWAESTIDVGSRFFVEIPKKIADQNNLSEIKADKVQPIETDETWNSISKAQTILIVEDNADMREYVRSLLSGDHTVLLAENGQKGLELVESKGKEIDLIISDVMMPVMDGFTMLQQLKEHDTWRNIPVIMLTARAAEEDKLHALTIGVDDYLTKPFSTAELQARVKNLIENYESRKLWQNDLLTIETSTETDKKTGEDGDFVEPNEISKQDLNWIKKVEAIISENIANENFDVESLSEQMFLSKRQFERKIKKITGLSPAKIVLEVRLKQARDYLEKDVYQTVSEVSYAIGIQTPSYFSNVYSKRFGKRPSSYFS